MQGWHTWLNDLQQLLVHGDEAVLVTVARTEGHAPRETGVRMIVARDRAFHTIGGGVLEWRAIEIGRRLLRDSSAASARHLERLTPSEPYAGSVTLAFERLSVADLGWVSALAKRFAAGEASVRSVSFADNSPVLLSDAEPRAATADCLLWDAGPLLSETIVLAPFQVMLFGAGHVGSALVRILATLPCQVTWIDDRPAQFAARGSDPLPSNVIIDTHDDPPSRIAQAHAGCSFIVMTYSDALDQELAERVLLRRDFAYLGVIGPAAKRHAMEHRFAARGIDPMHIARMHCPIGIEGIQGTAPEMVAISAAAQLLEVREANQRRDLGEAARLHGAFRWEDGTTTGRADARSYRTATSRADWRD